MDRNMRKGVGPAEAVRIAAHVAQGLRSGGNAGPELRALLILKNLPGVGKRTIHQYCLEPLRDWMGDAAPETVHGNDSSRRLEAPHGNDSGGQLENTEKDLQKRPPFELQPMADRMLEWLRPAGVQPAGPDFEAADAAARRILGWLEEHPDVRTVTVLEDAYPERLRDLGPDQPPVLYVRTGSASEQIALCTGGFPLTGKPPVDKQPANKPLNNQAHAETPPLSLLPYSGNHVAVIGSRWPGDRTFRNCPALIEELVRETGVVIISGLARGCDAIGHRAAMHAGGITGAVMASGIDIITPAMHSELAKEILQSGGFIMSEYDPGTEAAEFRYVERDRLIAALSDRILVLECEVRSGTMQTVKAGAALGRPLACVFPENEAENEAEAAEGNQYMRAHYRAEAVRSRAELLQWASEPGGGTAQGQTEPGGGTAQDQTEQMTFLT